MQYAYMVLVRDGLPSFTPKVPPTAFVKSSRKCCPIMTNLGKYPYPDTAFTNRDGSRDRAKNRT